ncbi:hypothetical protein QTP88_015797 [Uroleucon formosanum]
MFGGSARIAYPFNDRNCITGALVYRIISVLSPAIKAFVSERRRKQFSVDLEALKDIETQRKYATKVGNQLRKHEGQDINSEWSQAVTFIKEVAEQSIGRMENKRNKWFNEACRRAIEKRRVMRDNYNKERKNCKRVLKRKKRNFLNGILQEAEKDRSQGSIRNLFKTIKKYSTFNPSLKAVKDREGTILMKPEKKIIRWKEYFADLLDGTIPLDPIENKTFQKAEPLEIKTNSEISELTSIIIISSFELALIGKFVSQIWRIFFDNQLSTVLTKLEKIHEKLIRLDVVGLMKIKIN